MRLWDSLNLGYLANRNRTARWAVVQSPFKTLKRLIKTIIYPKSN